MVESDSTDASISKLQPFSDRDPNFNWCSLEKIDRPDLMRAERLAIARNRYIKEIRKKKYSDVSVVAVADFNSLSKCGNKYPNFIPKSNKCQNKK